MSRKVKHATHSISSIFRCQVEQSQETKKCPLCASPYWNRPERKELKKWEKDKFTEYRSILETFRKDYQIYIHTVNRYYGTSQANLRTQLHEQVPLVTQIVSIVHDSSDYTQDKTEYSFYSCLAYALDESTIKNNNWPHVVAHVDRIISEAMGRIDYGIFPRKEIKPVLSIKDHELSKRCSDLLNAPGSFDRVINQATQVLEERLWNSVPYERLCELLPNAKDYIGEPIAHRLLSPNNPVIVISDKPQERAAFHKMVVGIIAYLRNPSHHFLNDNTEWSLAWSVVGIVDALPSQIENSHISENE